jgi:hypothetical protein
VRTIPQPGAEVTILDLDAQVPGVVTEVLEGGRRVRVHGEDGRELEFALRGASATFTAAPDSNWPRLRFGTP